MKISAIIDGNVVSGTILLDNLDPLTIKLKHKYNDAGVFKYLILNTVSCQPQKEVFDYSFLNPNYFTELYIDVNGTVQQAMDPNVGVEEFEVSNPINDYVFTENQIPEVADIVVKEEIIRDDIQEFVALSHFPAPNLIDMEDLVVNDHFIFDEDRKLRFDVTTVTKTIRTEVFDLDTGAEITVAIQGTEPSACRLILINHRGEERTVNMTGMYSILDRHCFSSAVVSSTKDARVEVDYDAAFSGVKSVYIDDLYVGRTAQYFEAEAMDVREIIEDVIKISPITSLVFEFDRLPPFGLRNLLDVKSGDNGIKIQLSNSRIRVAKIVDNNPTQIIMSNTVPNDKQIGIVISDVDLKMYSDGNLVKTVSFSTPIPMGDYTAEIGASEQEPDYDSNAEIKLTVSNKNSFE
jgi:hypothetical protein